MPLRAQMTSALRARREERGLSLAQVGRRANLARTGVHAIETGVSGEYLDRLEALAGAVGARFEVALVPVEDTAERLDLLRTASVIPPHLAPSLLMVAQAWPYLTADDRELIAHLCERRRRPEPSSGAGEIIPLTESAPNAGTARRPVRRRAL